MVPMETMEVMVEMVLRTVDYLVHGLRMVVAVVEMVAVVEEVLVELLG